MDNFLTIIVAIAGIFGIFKIVNEITLSRTSKHRDDYEFTKNYLDDLNTHRFIIEKGFRALTNNNYSVEEIKYLLSQDEPMELIYLRASSKKIVYFDLETQLYIWNGIYKRSWFRKIISELLVMTYTVTAFLAVMLFLLNHDTNLLDLKFFIISISLGFFAVLALIKRSDFNDAVDFMNMLENEK